MKILYDYQTYYLQKVGGISNSFIKLIENFPAGIETKIALVESDNIHLKDSGLCDVPPMRNKIEDFLCKVNFKGKGTLYDIFSKMFPSTTALGRNRQYSINMLKEGDFDIFHPTFFDDYFLPYLKGKPFVLTVHDMIPELFSKRKNTVQIKNKPRLCKKASHVVVVSEKTKHDLMEILHVPECKITVIYHGAPQFFDVSTEKKIVEGKYILFVGQRSGYKGFDIMLKSLKPVLEKNNNLRLVCVGNEFSRYENTLLRTLGIIDRVILLHPDDHELKNIYANATCFIYPSLYEGFGIPILEAYSAQCPVLLNNKSCFPEIAKDAAIWFDLDYNHSNLTEVMENFLSYTTVERQQIIDLQNRRLKYFSWQKSAQELINVYKEVLM